MSVTLNWLLEGDKVVAIKPSPFVRRDDQNLELIVDGDRLVRVVPTPEGHREP